jgi:hypothetical protein
MGRRTIAVVMCIALLSGCHWWQRGMVAATVGVAGGYGLSTLAHCDPNDSTCSLSANQNGMFALGVITALGFWGLGELINAAGDSYASEDHSSDGAASSGGDGDGDGSSADGSSGDGDGSGGGSGDGSGAGSGSSSTPSGGGGHGGCPCGKCTSGSWQPVC